MKRLFALLAAISLSLASLVTAPTAALATEPTPNPDYVCPGVWVVVDSGVGQASAGCATEYSTGYEALKSAGFELEFNDEGMLCRIGGQPEKCETSAESYWSYWFAPRDSQTCPTGASANWDYYQVGGDTSQPKVGQIEGWRLGDGKAEPRTDSTDLRCEKVSVSQSAPVGESSPATPATQQDSQSAQWVWLAILAAVVIIAAAAGMFVARKKKL
ncbi:MAG: hypothetical protein LBR21_09035 [Propionibacteriaceae bacterium]|jgi:hypothetical protein|nr:hypothetical protein [Propionibacteriaceae bacterium]